MFGSLGVGVVHGTVQIFSAINSGTKAVEDDRGRHVLRQKRGLE